MARLGDPQNRLRILHVAGTKGKGSTSAMLASVLQRAGCRTGLFTSPHLCRVEERFQVDGVPIAAGELTSLLNEVRRAVDGLPHPAITFFEAATAVGFLHFVRRRVDAAVIEVGLGGRFDSTNVCRPAVAVITSISLDHTRQLGDRVAAIAMEKAGIVKPGRPTLSGADGRRRGRHRAHLPRTSVAVAPAGRRFPLRLRAGPRRATQDAMPLRGARPSASASGRGWN